MKVGTTKDQGLYDKPLAAVHVGALAAGTLPQYQYQYTYSTLRFTPLSVFTVLIQLSEQLLTCLFFWKEVNAVQLRFTV